jgi:hypothetical protein
MWRLFVSPLRIGATELAMGHFYYDEGRALEFFYLSEGFQRGGGLQTGCGNLENYMAYSASFIRIDLDKREESTLNWCGYGSSLLKQWLRNYDNPSSSGSSLVNVYPYCPCM